MFVFVCKNLCCTDINLREFMLVQNLIIQMWIQDRAEELKHELHLMRKGTAADKYRLEANELKEQLDKSTSELAMANARLKEMELRLTKSKSSTCRLQ